MISKIIPGDCIDVLKTFSDNYFDSIVTDPPYGINFMNKHWDYDVPKVEVWKECLRVLKPGGHILCACGTRTQHRMTVNIEDAGFEIRDVVAWIYGSGFPKSLNIGKAIDGLQGNKRIPIGERHRNVKPYDDGNGWNQNDTKGDFTYTQGNSEYEGWGTALKPAMELWTLARKPLSEKTVAENVLKWGTGGINVDGCRIEYTNDLDKASAIPQGRITTKVGAFAGKTQGGKNVELNKEEYEKQTHRKPRQSQTWEKGSGFKNETNTIAEANPQGRFPANLIHDGSDEVVSEFPDTNGGSGSASRFFYCAKASRSERNKGLEEMEDKLIAGSNPAIAELKRGNTDFEKKDENSSGYSSVRKVKNNHPTVKPIALMKYLCKLITPVNGIVLDPYMGSGSTGIACKLENFSFVGIEKEKQYCIIARARIKFW